MMWRGIRQTAFILIPARYATAAETTMYFAITGATNAAHIHRRIKRKISALIKSFITQ